MGTQRIVLTKSGRHELQTTVFVPDRHGLENLDNYHKRIIQYLNSRYGFDGWRNTEQTEAAKSTADAITLAEHTQKRFGQLDMIRRHAKNREKKIEKLLK